jgi:hypothetical protein
MMENLFVKEGKLKERLEVNKFISTPSQSGSNGDGNDYIFDPSQVTGAPAQH